MAPGKMTTARKRKRKPAPIARGYRGEKAVRAVVDYFAWRMFEWCAALMLLGLALHIAMWPHSIGASSFRFILLFVGSSMLGFMFFVAALIRIAALIANGSWPAWGPWLRAGGALMGSIIWAQMTLALLLLVPNVGTPPSPGIPVYAILAIFELISIYRALAADERHH